MRVDTWRALEADLARFPFLVAPAASAEEIEEASATLGWERYADDSVSIDRFGASAPGQVALENLGFTAANVARRARDLVARRGEPR